MYRLAGEIDMSSRDAMLERLLAAAEAADDRLVVDLAGVAFIDSSGLKALLMVREDLTARGIALLIRGAHGSVLRLFELTSLGELLEG